MPIYVYECDTCHDIYEVEQRIIEDALTECRCGEGKVKRVMQPVGVAFKGSGFYVNDGVKSDPTAKPQKSDPSKESTEKVETKSEPTAAESKPAEKKPSD